MENPQICAIALLSPEYMTVRHVVQWTSPSLTSSANVKCLQQRQKTVTDAWNGYHRDRDRESAFQDPESLGLNDLNCI